MAFIPREWKSYTATISLFTFHIFVQEYPQKELFLVESHVKVREVDDYITSSTLCHGGHHLHKAKCFRRYRTAQILLHSLAQQAKNIRDKDLLNKYREAVEKRLFNIQGQGNINTYDAYS